MNNAGNSDPFVRDGSDSRVSLFDDVVIDGIGLAFEQNAVSEGHLFVAGVDEVGRGCLAGPVVAAACILDIARPFPAGLDDSKKLTEKKRDTIAAELKQTCVAYAIGQVEADEIDRINILEATKRAMLLAIAGLVPAADYLLIDALHLKQSDLPQKAIIKGDSISASIAAASILAKTYRDDLMKAYDIEFPQYGFAGHKGYGAVTHFAALRIHGPCHLHRRSFRGVLQD
ncbi:MAG TPA: ribonuclease HII [Pyrinomonadaceae bacterium]|nr:ribonuclease HII [Pyrinomonadaceae bacterium]HQX54353.1 ribonuclease HII [Pyrinomonadaceae bacterium]HQY65947.1 ribonuclease HII [Pyrinomonadaceae bacterium]HRA38950.1 ribonuclease HII [Pyrinomonadaceae bacterium]